MREAEGVAAQVLMYLGLRLDQVRDETRNLLGFAHDSNGGAPIQSPGAMKSIGLDLEHLPESVRKIVSEFDCQIEILMLDKESAVANQEWKKAAMLRDLGDKLKKLRHEFLAHWPPKWSDLSAE
jgi:hypothetical protein